MKKVRVMAQGPLIDWDAFQWAGKSGRILELLRRLPRESWAKQNEDGRTLLHLACRGPNEVAVAELIQSGLVDVNAPDRWGHTAVHLSILWAHALALMMLCAAGANLRAREHFGYTPMDYALDGVRECGDDSVRVLVANGVRLEMACEQSRCRITPELAAFEQGVLRCRSAVAALLSVKRVGNLWRWDKFLLRELAYAMWATRMGKQ